MSTLTIIQIVMFVTALAIPAGIFSGFLANLLAEKESSMDQHYKDVQKILDPSQDRK